MQLRTDCKNGKKLSALGFGCMRFPTSGGRIDVDASEKLILSAVQRGVNYLDTAYAYNGNEAALGEILARNPGLRDKVNIATKLPIPRCQTQDDFDTYLSRSLERLGTDRVDYYLIHNVTSVGAWERLEELGIKEWARRQKEAGRIGQIGFSYHGCEADFPTLLDSYDWDFCQIQYNYMNEHYQAGTAGLKAAAERGIPVIIMEPLLGGKLASELPAAAQTVLEQANISTDPVRLALRWVWNHPEVTLVLSGMNAMQQLDQNIETANAALPCSLTAEEARAIEIARAFIAERYKVPCTGCGYCLPCPKGVNIPMCFAAYNTSFAHGWYQGMHQYIAASGAMEGKAHFASDCVQCGACQKKCPQHIDIPKELISVKRRLQVPGLPSIVRLGTRFMTR
ncbi:aldo/keto reductase [Adlercreutzia sp. ZJ141]|uniref:aldo/keto reductase n=1 Tax=Adlercreutzia sp. ZJ141 TaxID=2709406 RepID=UPI0013EDD6B6|nr:aldo/keto reductase [Adlercreutzia sp. ZJ141]